MKKIILVLTVFVLGLRAFGLEIVYPKSQNVTIKSNRTFFIGNCENEVKVNGQIVPRNNKGAFAYVVPLKVGENIFTFETTKEKVVYKITRPAPISVCYGQQKPVEYTELKGYMITKENAPLRSSPVNAGINRVSHLPIGVGLNVNGENGEFYRVLLDNNETVWVAKTDVMPLKNNDYANLKGYDYIDTDEYFTFVFHLDKKVPFVITEGSTMTLKLYNIKDKSPYIMDFPYSEASGTDQLYGYSGEFIGNDFIWKIRKPLKYNSKHPLKDIKITIDAGHGGNECGAISCFGDKEKDVNLKLAILLQEELKKRGAKVYMTREDDSAVGLHERVEFANEKESVILISVHGNALPDNLDPNKNRGTSIYYYYDMSKPLAESIISEMTMQLGVNNDKIRQGSLALTRNTNALSILVEVGYLINPEDSVMLRDNEFQKSAARAMSDGIEKFIKNK